MPVRLGIDVGGTFTKAAAVDVTTGEVVARAVVPTSHDAPDGIASGVVAVLAAASAAVDRAGVGPIVMVGHSTSLAVNALLEGDLPVVGLVGIGRAPDLGPAKRRTDIGRLALAPGRVLEPRYRFVDATRGLDAAHAGTVIDELVAEGARSIAVSEAFAVDDPAGEIAILAAAAERGLPACAGHQLTGVLGLELRTVSALVNAAILPRAQATAAVVAEGLAAAGVHAPLVILRGDGGATDLAGFAALPLRSLFSGPAASVSGALHHLDLGDGLMLEVGGTSTNIAIVRGRRPRLAYVRVGAYATCLRSLDVWVAGVAGGSLARIKGRRVIAVGPRSAHIAGLPYAAFAEPAMLAGARAALVAPRAGDSVDHLVVDADGGRFALTVTCAANATGVVTPDSYAAAPGGRESAELAFAAAGRLLGVDPRELANSMLQVAAAELERTLRAAASAAGTDVRSLAIVGVGGGAGALVPSLAASLGVRGELARHAEILSSIGAATSLIQAVEERSAAAADESTIREAIDASEAAAMAAGAAPASLETTTEFDAARRLLRAITTGSLPLEAGGPPPADPVDEATLLARAGSTLGLPPEELSEVGRTAHYIAFAGPEAGQRPGRGAGRPWGRGSDAGRSWGWGRGSGAGRPWALVDRRGTVAHHGVADAILVGSGEDFANTALEEIRRAERHVGPASVAPPVVVVSGRRVVDCSPMSTLAGVLRAVEAEVRPSTSGSAADRSASVIVAIEREGGR
ncbi:MAG: hydantoinase/oxoprolinase family protein [Chloroflexota bacterium]